MRLRARPRQPKLQRRTTNMSYMLNPGAPSEANVEVHKYYSGTVLAVCFLALVLQAFLHKFGHWADMVMLQRSLGSGGTTAPDVWPTVAVNETEQ